MIIKQNSLFFFMHDFFHQIFFSFVRFSSSLNIWFIFRFLWSCFVGWFTKFLEIDFCLYFFRWFFFLSVATFVSSFHSVWLSVQFSNAQCGNPAQVNVCSRYENKFVCAFYWKWSVFQSTRLKGHRVRLSVYGSLSSNFCPFLTHQTPSTAQLNQTKANNTMTNIRK